MNTRTVLLACILTACGTAAPETTTAMLAQKETAPAAEVVDGKQGANAVILSHDLEAGDQCPAGGVRYTSWIDRTEDQGADGQPVFTPETDKHFASRVVCNGVAGADGQDGLAGQAGEDGQDGAQGPQGLPGTPGESAAGFQVVDNTSAVVGTLVWVNPANSDYHVVKDDLRMQFARTVGHFPYAYTFCTAVGCTGTCKLAITNGVFANVFEIYETATPVRATGRADSANFAYASRRMGSSCTNQGGTTSGLYEMEVLTAGTLGFTYPIAGAELLNTAGGVQ